MIVGMDIKDAIKLIGSRAYSKVHGAELEVKIKDVKQTYGHFRFLVAPIAGKGEFWTEKIELITK